MKIKLKADSLHWSVFGSLWKHSKHASLLWPVNMSRILVWIFGGSGSSVLPCLTTLEITTMSWTPTRRMAWKALTMWSSLCFTSLIVNHCACNKQYFPATVSARRKDLSSVPEWLWFVTAQSWTQSWLSARSDLMIDSLMMMKPPRRLLCRMAVNAPLPLHWLQLPLVARIARELLGTTVVLVLQIGPQCRTCLVLRSAVLLLLSFLLVAHARAERELQSTDSLQQYLF